MIPFFADSSLGCAICDPVIALWRLAGGRTPRELFRGRGRGRGRSRALGLGALRLPGRSAPKEGVPGQGAAHAEQDRGVSRRWSVRWAQRWRARCSGGCAWRGAHGRGACGGGACGLSAAASWVRERRGPTPLGLRHIVVVWITLAGLSGLPGGFPYQAVTAEVPVQG
ncbi:DUF6010 family protein [Streptomyces acidicola]|uniref:DUF6010 family protein n=1 Tax=Streptomyces acidicola TaxID=2596892 RepID=UPI00379D0BE8